jgi:hypothetical protein
VANVVSAKTTIWNHVEFTSAAVRGRATRGHGRGKSHANTTEAIMTQHELFNESGCSSFTRPVVTTLGAIGSGSEAGVSARLRDFRKSDFGGHVVNRRRRGECSLGVFEYQLEIKS